MLLLVSAALIVVRCALGLFLLSVIENICMQIIAPPFALPFLQPSLAFSLIYIWSRKNPHEQVALFWIIQLPAPYVRSPSRALTYHLTQM
jgi:hypothetical protein